MTGEPTVDTAEVAERAAALRQRIVAAGGDDRVRVVAVTKGFGADAARAALAAGLVDLGESYAQELVAKAAAVGPGPRWHFVGRIQTNKVRSVAGVVQLWQSVDRAAVGDEVARRAPGAHVLVQVNVSGEAQKGGCQPSEAGVVVEQLRASGLHVGGLMAVGATGPIEATRPGFRLLRQLADDLGLAELSMGMTADLEVAVEEGATLVRVGRGLFGERPRPDAVGSRH